MNPTSPSGPERALPDATPVPSFDLRFRPSVELISLVRRFVADFYLATVENDDVASRLAVATHELLENAAKYSTDGETLLQVALDRNDGTVTVCTVNRANPVQIEALRRNFIEIASAPDVAALYSRMLRRSALESGSGGLGLGRILAESEMALRLVVEGDRVEIHARGKIETTG